MAEANQSAGETAEASKTIQADSSTGPEKSPSQATSSISTSQEPPAAAEKAGKVLTGNKFFRSNRLSDAELKKRDYVARELQATGRSTRSSVVKTEPTGDGPEDEANFMAGVGVVSAHCDFQVISKNHPVNRNNITYFAFVYLYLVGQRRQGRRVGRGRSAVRAQDEVMEEPDVPQEEPDEMDDVCCS